MSNDGLIIENMDLSHIHLAVSYLLFTYVKKLPRSLDEECIFKFDILQYTRCGYDHRQPP